jgi:hypothetical protein
MDQEALVSQQLIDDGKRFIERLVAEGMPVAAALWVKESENGRWYLYIVTPLVTADGDSLEAYGPIGDVYRQMPEPFSIGRFQTRPVSPSSPVGKAVVYRQEHYPGKGPFYYPGYRLGDVSFEGAYIYRPIPAAAA